MGKYFLGGESYADSTDRAFYFQRSRILPQQTSLLGLIRHQLLLQNGKIHFNKGADQLKDVQAAQTALMIGTQSFDPEDSSVNIYGIINQLSPVFLSKGKSEMYFPAFRVKDEGGKLSYPRFETKEGLASFNGKNSWEKVPYLAGYHVKRGLELGFQNYRDDEDFLTHSEIILAQEEIQIGIYKSQIIEERNEREGLFKLAYKRLSPEWGFGFLLSLSSGFNFQSNPLVTFGKEKSPFRLEVTKLSEEESTKFPLINQEVTAGSRVRLLSDAYINPRELLEVCSGIISQDQSFRCLTTYVKNSFSYDAKPRRFADPSDRKKALTPVLSPRYNLLKAGSLLHIKDPQPMGTHSLYQIFEKDHFHTIGYNSYMIN